MLACRSYVDGSGASGRARVRAYVRAERACVPSVVRTAEKECVLQQQPPRHTCPMIWLIDLTGVTIISEEFISVKRLMFPAVPEVNWAVSGQ